MEADFICQRILELLDEGLELSDICVLARNARMSYNLEIELSKTETRRIAEENGFINAKKHDSQDICFVPDGDYAGFVERYTEMQVSEDPRDLNIQTVYVDFDSRWIGKTAKEIEDSDDVAILLVRRGMAKIIEDPTRKVSRPKSPVKRNQNRITPQSRNLESFLFCFLSSSLS